MGRSTKVQRAFSKAREAEARRQKEIRIAQDEVDNINKARTIMNFQKKYNNPSSDPNPEHTRYVYERRVNVRNNTVRLHNTRANRWDVVPLSSIASIASRDLASAQARVDQLKAQPSRAISMEQANKMVGSQRSLQRGASLASAKASGTSLSSVTGSGLVQKAYADSQSAEVKKRITSAQARDPVNQFLTGSGNLTVSRGGQVIQPASQEGQVIQGIYDRQQAQRAINMEQKKLFDRVTGAKNYKEAFNIQEKSRSVNPNVGTFQQVYRGGNLVESRGVEGIGTGVVVRTDKAGNPVSLITPPQDFFNPTTGQRVATVTEVSGGAMPRYSIPTQTKASATGFNFFDSNVKTQNIGFGLNQQTVQPQAVQPQKKDPVMEFFSGISDPFVNIGTTISAVPEASKRIITTGDPYAGQKYFDTEVMPQLRPTGLDRVFGVEPNISQEREAGTWVGDAIAFFSPIPASKGLKGTGLASRFSGTSKFSPNKPTSTRATQIYDSLSKDTARPTIKDQWLSFWGKQTPTQQKPVITPFTSTSLNLGRGVARSNRSSKGSGTGGGGNMPKPSTPKPSDPTNFFTPKTSGSQQLVQVQRTTQQFKTRPIWLGKGTTQNAKLLTQNVKPQNVKPKTQLKQQVKNLQKQKIDNIIGTKAKPKTISAQNVRQFYGIKQKPQSKIRPLLLPRQIPRQTPRQTQKTPTRQDATTFLMPPKRPTTRRPPLILPFFGMGGGARRGSRGMRRGTKSYTAWNVNPNKVLGFLGGASYTKSYSQSIFKQLDKKTKKAGSDKFDNTKDPVKDFFG